MDHGRHTSDSSAHAAGQAMASLRACRWRAGSWWVDPQRNVIEREGQALHLEPKVMDVLVFLAARRGEVVNKEELIREVWEGRFVTEDVITVSIHELRKALGDSARTPQFIETIPRRGYRWIAAVTQVPRQGAVAEARIPAAPVAGLSARRWLAIAATMALLAAAGGWAFSGAGWRASATSERKLQIEAAYLKGRHFLDQRTQPALALALRHFEEAVRLHPEFAEAWASIALAHSMIADTGYGDRAELYGRAREAAQRALELRPESAEGHAAMGMIRLVFDWDFAAAEAHLRRAVRANPELREAHQYLAWLLSAVGRHDQAIAEARLAVALDPVSTARYTELAWAMSYAGQYREGVAEVNKALELDPQFFEGHITKGLLLEWMGNTAAAYAAIRTGYARREGSDRNTARLDAIFQKEGLRGIYRSWLRAMQAGSAGMPRNEVWRASLHSRIGEVEQAIAALQSAYQRREGGLAWLGVNPSFLPLRYDARFQSLLQQIGLAN